MKAAVYEEFQQPSGDPERPRPDAEPDWRRFERQACGICRSDWHGWMGNDPDIKLPHVPGMNWRGRSPHGIQVSNFKLGDRVTLPFVCGCGTCGLCRAGDQQVCDNQFQPGFSAWGGFAEYVAIEYADKDLVRLPDEVDLSRGLAWLPVRHILPSRQSIRAKSQPDYGSLCMAAAVSGCQQL